MGKYDELKRAQPTVSREMWPMGGRGPEASILSVKPESGGGLHLLRHVTPQQRRNVVYFCSGANTKSTFAGLPWLLYLRNWCERPIHFWPFDGWEVPEGKSVVAEVYPSLWTRRFPKEGRDGDEQAAYAVAAWLQRADQDGSLGRYKP